MYTMLQEMIRMAQLMPEDTCHWPMQGSPEHVHANSDDDEADDNAWKCMCLLSPLWFSVPSLQAPGYTAGLGHTYSQGCVGGTALGPSQLCSYAQR